MCVCMCVCMCVALYVVKIIQLLVGWMQKIILYFLIFCFLTQMRNFFLFSFSCKFNFFILVVKSKATEITTPEKFRFQFERKVFQLNITSNAQQKMWEIFTLFPFVGQMNFFKKFGFNDNSYMRAYP